MRAIKYILSAIIILIIAGIFGRYAAKQAFDRRSHKTTIPVNSGPTYEYATEGSTEFAFPQYVSSEHRFRARFPSGPTITTVGLVTQYGSVIEGEGAYNVFVNSLEAALANDEDVTTFLDGILQGKLSVIRSAYGDKFNLKRSQAVRILGQHALEYEYTIDIEGHTLYSQGVYFPKGRFVYGITVVCLEGAAALAYSKYDYLIKSFELIE